jgi:hypothetical protein
MTTPRIEKIGLVAHFSQVGDWAFDAALKMGRARQTVLHIYHFLESPYGVPRDVAPAELEVQHRDEKTLVARDREVRERFDDRLGDFVEVGFKTCESGRHNQELRRCLLRHEYQLLILPYLRCGVGFGNMSIEEFAYRFTAPVMLVGPERPDQFHFNPTAVVLHGSAHLVYDDWRSIPEPEVLQQLPVI